MRAGAVIFTFFAIATAFADDFTLDDGTEYKAVKVTRAEPDGLVVTTASGITKLFFSDLPKEVQGKYHYDPKKAEAFRFRLHAARDAAADEVSAAAEREKQKGHEPPVRPPAGESRHADAAPAIRSLSLDAHEIGTADSYQSYWETDWGSYDRNYARGKRILVTIHDLSRKVPKCQIDVYFIARPLFTPSVHFIYDHRRLYPHLRARLETSGPLGARELRARMVNLAALGRRYGRGADMDGWIVIARVGERVFGVRASSQTLLDIAQNESRANETLKDLIAQYDSTQGSY